jgi:hypothetical protein
MKRMSDLGVSQTARVTGFSTKHIYDLLQSGRIAARKRQGRWCIPQSSLQCLLERPSRVRRETANVDRSKSRTDSDEVTAHRGFRPRSRGGANGQN